MVILFPKFDIPGYFPRVCGCWCMYTPVYLIELYTLLNINLLLVEIFIFKSQDWVPHQYCSVFKHEPESFSILCACDLRIYM